MTRWVAAAVLLGGLQVPPACLGASFDVPPYLVPREQFDPFVVSAAPQLFEKEILPRLTPEEYERLAAVQVQVETLANGPGRCSNLYGVAYAEPTTSGKRIVLCAEAMRHLMLVGDLLTHMGGWSGMGEQEERLFTGFLEYYAYAAADAQARARAGLEAPEYCIPWLWMYINTRRRTDGACTVAMGREDQDDILRWYHDEGGPVAQFKEMYQRMGVEPAEDIQAVVGEYQRHQWLVLVTVVLAHEAAHVLNGDLDDPGQGGDAMEQRADLQGMSLMARSHEQSFFTPPDAVLPPIFTVAYVMSLKYAIKKKEDDFEGRVDDTTRHAIVDTMLRFFDALPNDQQQVFASGTGVPIDAFRKLLIDAKADKDATIERR